VTAVPDLTNAPAPPPPPEETRMRAVWARAIQRRAQQRAALRVACVAFLVQGGVMVWDLAGGLATGWGRVLIGTAYWWIAGALLMDVVTIILITALGASIDVTGASVDGYFAEACARELAESTADYYRALYAHEAGAIEMPDPGGDE
jgi:hypothetical protein